MEDTSGPPTRRYARVPLDVGRLRELRLAKGWSQHELSVHVGVQGAPAVSAWETGASVPHPRTLVRLAQVLGVESSDLLERKSERVTFAELRVASGLSRRGLAASTSVSLTTIRRWEAGDFKSVPPARMLEPVAAALGVPMPRVLDALEVSRRVSRSFE